MELERIEVYTKMTALPSQKKNKKAKNEYYAIYLGRVDEPTIFSSWGDAHPRLTGCEAKHGAFPTLEEARNFLREKCGVPKPKEVFKEGAGETAPLPGSQAFYAVANGENPGIYPCYYGKKGADLEVRRFKGSCHKVFRTRAQAEAFIEDWKDSYADIWRKAIREALEYSRRPTDMKIKVEQILSRLPKSDDPIHNVKMENLSIKEESGE